MDRVRHETAAAADDMQHDHRQIINKSAVFCGPVSAAAYNYKYCGDAICPFVCEFIVTDLNSICQHLVISQ
ncbi:hypothetical protein CA54_58810 [Symmachiella macrocystis]|uniref:Uncharacterized protein n=1 Tax=Symmachiella macrocystis TaxID=2527985 RepID=A0A5C6AYY5_9PLAN|nr:hypothetical protein CA54_58810 [Symmachiella macrocystis]